MNKSAGYSKEVADFLLRKELEKKGLVDPDEELHLLADAARKTDPVLRQRAVDKQMDKEPTK